MPIDLLGLQPTVISKNLRGKYVLIYGPPKIGKTSLAVQFPKTLLFALEPGYNGLVNQMVQPIHKWGELKESARQLDDPRVKETYDTVIIDTVDIAWDYCEKYICSQNPDDNGVIPKNLGEIPYGKGYDLCKKEYDRLFREIAMMGYGIVFISHEQAKTIKTEEGVEYQKFMPTLPDRPRLIINRMVDIIGYLRSVAPKDGEAKRMMFMRDNQRFEAGSRFKYLTDRIELSYDNLVHAIYEAIDKQVAEEGGTAISEFVNVYAETNSRPFEDAMDEARELWTKLAQNETNVPAMMNIIEKNFGRRMKLSEALPEQLELLEQTIVDMKKF